MMVDKWVLGLFNRATYGRMKAFLDYCRDRKDIDLTIILGSSMNIFAYLIKLIRVRRIELTLLVLTS